MLSGHNCTKKRNSLIQIIRAISIIAVVIIHTTPDGIYQVICRPFVNFSVATFLFLSGYLTRIENDNWGLFFRKRCSRVIIPYIIWTIIYLIPYLYNNGDNFILVLIKNLLTAKAAGPFYYVLVYIQFVLLTPLLSRLVQSKYIHIGWLVTPISMIIFTYYPLLQGVQLNNYILTFWDNSCLGWFTYYYLGLILGNRILLPNYSINKLIFIYIISIFLQMIEGYCFFLCGIGNCGSQIKLSSLITSCIFLLIIYDILKSTSYNITSRILNSIGNYSFGIYLCHIMVILVLRQIPIYSHVYYPITSVIVVAISWAGCYICSIVFGKKASKYLGVM